jgi:hypothetical protein
MIKMTNVKYCSGCKLTKDTIEFNKCKSKKDGFNSTCKACCKVYHSKYYEKNKEKIIERTGRYYSENVKRYSAWSKEWAANNPERARARYLKYRHGNLEKCRANDESYRLRNMGKDAAKTAKRRATKVERTPKWLTVEQLSTIDAIYEQCAKINKLTGVMHHVDHIVPLNGKNVSGLHVPWNLRIVTAKVNLSKSNKFSAGHSI